MFACDVDGVVANFSLGFSTLLNEIDGKNRLPIIRNNNTKSWLWEEWYAMKEISRNDLHFLIEKTWEDNIKTKGNILWSGLKPLFPDAMNTLNLFSKEAPIVFITRRDGPGAWQETSAWLHRYGVDNPMVYIIRPGEEKGAVCRKMNITTIIDDSPTYAPELMQNGVDVIMPRWDYNKEFIQEYLPTTMSTLHPVHDLNEALVKAIRRV